MKENPNLRINETSPTVQEKLNKMLPTFKKEGARNRKMSDEAGELCETNKLVAGMWETVEDVRETETNEKNESERKRRVK